MTPDREALARRIRALRAKTVENGCTEAEAVAAAEALNNLLAKYNMTIDEAEIRASPFTQHTESHTDLVGARLWRIAGAISELIGVRWWTSSAGVYPIEINFFGLDHEVEVARYMLEICAGAMRREAERLLDSNPDVAWSPRRSARLLSPFLDGMADRLQQRIRAMAPPQPTGTGLVVLKNSLVDQAMKDAGHELRDRDTRRSRDLEPGYLDGLVAGDRVALNPGINGGGSNLFLRGG